MSYQIKQSSTAYPLLFLLVDSTDHIAGLTGLSPTVTLRKPGGAFAAPAGAVTEVGNGWYQVAGNATDNNTAGPLVLHATAPGADPADMIFEVVSYGLGEIGLRQASDGDVLAEVRKLLRNKRIINVATGIETIYDDNGATLFTRQVYSDAAGAAAYDGAAAPHRVERYT